MNKFFLSLISLLLFGCDDSISWKDQEVVFDLTCKPIEDMEYSLKSEAIFSNENINFRYGTVEQEYNILLGENFVIDQINPIAISKGKIVPEKIYRIGSNAKLKRYSFAVDRERMGVVIYTYQETNGVLTETYLNYETNHNKEAILVSQSLCKPYNA